MKKIIALISVLCMLTAMTACVDTGPAGNPTVPQELEFTPYDSWCVVSGIGTCTDAHIIIPDTYNGLPVTSIGDFAFRGCQDLTSITIPASITSIGEGAFNNCDNLKNVYISDLAAWCKIDFAFVASPLHNGTTLYLNGVQPKDITIPDGITNIGNYTFINCTSLTRVTIPEGVTSIVPSRNYRPCQLERQRYYSSLRLRNIEHIPMGKRKIRRLQRR